MDEPNDSDDKLAGLPIQPATDGSGPLYHRRYFTDFVSDGRSPEKLMLDLQADPNQFAPQIMARFEKTKGEPNILRVGDHFLVHITGPWNGPVEVSDVTPNSFTLITLSGHMEAGRIRFQIGPADASKFRFMIESWARSRDSVVDFVYDKIGFARAAQSTMWISYCRAFAQSAREQTNIKPEVEVETAKWDGTTWVKMD